MMMNQKRLLHGLGSALALLGVLFVVWRLHQYSAQVNLLTLSWNTCWAIVGLSIIYGLLELGLVFAWREILIYLHAPVTVGWAIQTYGISQIAKYTPGNIFHLAGRQGMGMAANLPAWSLAKSMIWEHGLLAAAAVLCGGLAIPLVVPFITMIEAGGGVVVCSAGIYMGLRRYISVALAQAFLWYAGFLLVSGALFTAVLRSVSTHSLGDWGLYVGAYVIAWLIGLVTPGAPAGMGIREVVLLALLPATVVTKDALLLAIVLGRVVTVLGDVWFYIAAYCVGKVKRHD